MTQKEKASELFEKYYEEIEPRFGRHDLAKRCALIAVDEVLFILSNLHKPEYTTFIESCDKKELESSDIRDGYELKDYFEEVKQELKQL